MICEWFANDLRVLLLRVLLDLRHAPHAVLERGKPDSLAHKAHDGRALRMILEHSV